MRGNSFNVAVQLAFTQSALQSMHTNAFMPIAPTEMALDFAVAQTVRGGCQEGQRHEDRFITAVCMYGAMTYFASDLWTLPLAPILSYSHHNYNVVRSTLSPPTRRFVAGSFLTIVNYFQPLLIRHDATLLDGWWQAASVLAVMVAASHLDDLQHLDLDRNDGVTSKVVPLCLVALGLLVHQAPTYNTLDYAYDLAVVVFALTRSTTSETRPMVALIATVLMAARFNNEFVVHLASMILASSEPLHSRAISAVPWIIEHTRDFPKPVRDMILDNTLQMMPLGDRIGSSILTLYSDLVRRIYLDRP